MFPALSRRDLMVAGAAVALAGAASADAAQPFGLPGQVGSVSPWLKRNDFIRRSPTVSLNGFIDHWIQVHSLLLADLPGLRKAVLNVVDHDHSPGIDFDGVEELFFENDAAYARAMDDAARNHALAEDEALFAAPERLRLFTREVVIRDFHGPAPAASVKRFGLVKRTPPLTHADFVKTWRDDHAPEANAMPGLIRYTLNVADFARSADAPRDGYAELWWTDMATYDADAAQRARDRAKMAAQGVMGPTEPSLLMIVQPHQVV